MGKIVLSRTIGPGMPTYADDPQPVFDPVCLIEDGDPGNWHHIHLFNHCSTHVDAPWHFNQEGPRITDLDPSWWIYDEPRVIDVPKDDDGLIEAADLEPHRERLEGCDLLLVRTGYAERVRNTEPDRWAHHAPGFGPSAAEWLKENSEIRCLGMDLPSATAPQHPDPGIAFHRLALGMTSPGFFLIVEDVRLDADLNEGELGRVVMAPMLLEGLDGAPVTMFGFGPNT